MRELKNNYLVDRTTAPPRTPFEADMLRYMHISDCEVILKVWKEYWPACPICGALENKDGVMVHAARTKEAVS